MSNKQEANKYKNWTLTDRQICDLELIIDGSFNPLTGFLNEQDYNNVVDNMQLSTGSIWPIPIILDVKDSILSNGFRSNAHKCKNKYFNKILLVGDSNVEAKFLKDEQLKSRLDDINKKIVSAKYIESLMVGRTSVGVAEIDNFYEKNKEQFSRKSDEVFVLLFSEKNKNTAISIKNTLDRNGLDSEKSSALIKKHNPRRIFFNKAQLNEKMSKRLFGSKKNSSFIIERDKGFAVFYIIDVFKKGSVKDLVYVNDEIQSKILALKNHILKERIIDSLTVGYGKN